jgi:transposase
MTVPGIGWNAACAILAELSGNFEKFPSAGRLATRAGVAPIDRESAGKSRGAKTRKASNASSPSWRSAPGRP